MYFNTFQVGLHRTDLHTGCIPRSPQPQETPSVQPHPQPANPSQVRALGLISPATSAAFHACATTHADPSLRRVFLTQRMARAGAAAVAIAPRDEWRWPGAAAMNSLHRARFLERLVRRVPAGVASFGKQLVDAEVLGEGEGEGGVRLRFADGSRAVADALVGFDGIKSRTRDALMRLQGKELVVPQDAGMYAYRDLMDMKIAEEVLGPQIAHNGSVWKSYGAYLVMYPVEHGEMLNIVVSVQNKIGLETSLDQLIIPATKEEALRDTAGFDPRLISLIKRFKSYNRWLLFDLIHQERYYWKRICIAGDAAHASTPHLGAGAGMAIEDAYILGNLIAEATSAAQLEKVFRVFDEVRRPRTQRLVERSRRTGNVHSLQEPPLGVGDDVEKNRLDAMDAYYWIWNFRLEDQLEEAKKLL